MIQTTKRWTWRKPARSQGAALQELEDEYGGYNSDTYETAPTKPATTQAPAVADEDQALEVEMYIRCEDILATRGTRTDSFVRVILIEDDTLAEHEVGRTEVQDDTLDPEYRHPVQLKFRLDDEKHRLRIELCDPGETKDKVSPSSTSNAAPDPNPNPDASHCPLTLTLALTPSPHFPLLQTRVRSDSPTLTLTLTLT